MLRYRFFKLKLVLCVLTAFESLLTAQSAKDFKWQEGEELVYEVDWEFVYLGTITMSNLGQRYVNGQQTYHIKVVIESNPLLFWLDHQSTYNTYVTEDLKVMRFISNENIDDVPYNAQYDFDYANKNIKLSLFDEKNPANTRIKDIPLKDKLIDGIGLIQYARAYSMYAHKDTVATFIEDKSGDVIFDFSLPRQFTKTDAFPQGIRTVYFNGELFMKGIAGITGPFETWYSDDSARVPILAYMEVFIGEVDIELVRWKKWSPTSLIVEKRD